MAGEGQEGGGGVQPTFEESGATFAGGEIFESDGGVAAGVPAGAPAGAAAGVPGKIAPASAGLAEGTKMDQVPLLDRETAELLAGTTKFMIQQDLKWMEAITGGCVEQKNAYSVIDPDTNRTIMVVKEESDVRAPACAPPTAPPPALLLLAAAAGPAARGLACWGPDPGASAGLGASRTRRRKLMNSWTRPWRRALISSTRPSSTPSRRRVAPRGSRRNTSARGCGRGPRGTRGFGAAW